MSTITVPVTFVAADQNGDPVAGARVTATLDMTEVYQGFVVPDKVEAVANAAGLVVLSLWPNALGVNGSRYRIQARDGAGKRFLDALVSVPNSPCNLHEILVQEPYPPIDAAQQALAAAQGALALVTTQAGIATAERVLAQQASSAAGGFADTATTQAGIATARAGQALASQNAAAGSAADAAADRVQTGLDRSATGLDRAQTGLDAATATSKAGEASASAATASAKASEASASASSAAADRVQTGLDRVATGSDVTASGLSAATATAQAGIATTKALESSASAAASQASASATAFAVVDQLNNIKSQTEAIRDQAMDGLGAADNSQALSALLGSIVYATDMALKGLDGISENRGTFGSTDRAELFAYMFGELLDKIGVIGRAISGGTIELQGGTAAIPSLTSATDVATGVFFPANGVMAVATAALERLRITADGRLGLGTNAPSGLLDVADNKLRVRTAQTPASATAAGNQGEWAWDANFVYVCINTNTWRRAALTTW